MGSSIMGMQKADEAVAQLAVDISDKQKVLDAVIHLHTTYPDLLVDRDPFVASSIITTKFSSAGANKIAEDVDVFTRIELEFVDCEGESCVKREVVEAWPYTTLDGYKVYSVPSAFDIGEVNSSGFGITPFTQWEDLLDASSIALEAVRKARNYLRKNPPIQY